MVENKKFPKLKTVFVTLIDGNIYTMTTYYDCRIKSYGGETKVDFLEFLDTNHSVWRIRLDAIRSIALHDDEYVSKLAEQAKIQKGHPQSIDKNVRIYKEDDYE